MIKILPRAGMRLETPNP